MTFYLANQLCIILVFMTFTLWCLTPKYTIIAGKNISIEILVTNNGN